MNQCQSCGMPMEKPEDFGGGKVGNPYCKYCSDYQGNLLPRDQVRQNMIQFYIKTMGKSPGEAAIAVDQVMATMPAWRQTGPAWQVQSPASPPSGVPSEPVLPPTPLVSEPVIEIDSLSGKSAAEPLKEVEAPEESTS